MFPIDDFISSLRPYFKWHPARLYCFAAMIVALFTVRTVNLREIAIAFISDALVDSRYKRLRRFFTYFKIDTAVIARWIFSLYISSNKQVYITIDRTNWYWGKSKINVLVVAIAHEGVAIPLFCEILNTGGNATAEQHIAILQRFVDVFGTDCIASILGDREFASYKLFTWCNCSHANKIPFHIRVKEKSLAKIKKGKGKGKHVRHLFSHLNPKEHGAYPYIIELYDAHVYVAGSRSETGELMIVVTNQSSKNAIAIYLRRWEIETLFSCLKERGFNFEDTRMTEKERLEKLMCLLAVAVAWVHKIGEWRAELKPIRFKIYRGGIRRPQYSYFRYGLDFIREAIFQASKKCAEFKACIDLITDINAAVMEAI